MQGDSSPLQEALQTADLDIKAPWVQTAVQLVTWIYEDKEEAPQGCTELQRIKHNAEEGQFTELAVIEVGNEETEAYFIVWRGTVTNADLIADFFIVPTPLHSQNSTAVTVHGGISALHALDRDKYDKDLKHL